MTGTQTDVEIRAADDYSLEALKNATTVLANSPIRTRDKRGEGEWEYYEGPETDLSGTDLPEPLFERVARAMSSVLQAYCVYSLHASDATDRNAVTFTAYDALKDEGSQYVEVELHVKETPSDLNYLANTYSQVSNMGAALRSSERTPGSSGIPDGWMRVRYRFYPPETTEAFDEKDDHNYPPVEEKTVQHPMKP